MHKLESLDVRLLKLFAALDRHRSVSRAAEALDLPQPVVSQGLRRLRMLFDDQLFVRTGGGMVPTSAAATLRDPIEALLAIVNERILPEPRFEPAQSAREFRIVASDFGAVTLLPQLMPRLQTEAPGVCVRMLPLDRDVFPRLSSTDADLALGILGAAPTGIRTREVFRDRYVCALRAGHPALDPGLPIGAFRAARHVTVSSRLDSAGAGDAAIAAHLAQSNVVLDVPSYAALPSLLARTDLIAIVPRTASGAFFAGLPIAFVDVPFTVPPITVVEAWHERHDGDLGLRWLRDLVADAVTASDAVARGDD